MKPPDVSDLFRDALIMDFKKQSLILEADSEPDGIYYIESGMVKAYSVNKRGEVYIHLVYGQGEVFPLGWVLDPSVWHVNFQALTNVKVRLLKRRQFMDKVSRGGAASEQFFKYIGHYLTVYSDRVQNLEYKYASERVAYRLLFMAGRFGVRKGDAIWLEVPITQLDLANTVNLSRKSVQREIDRLIRKQLVKIEGHTIVLLDYRALAAELGNSLDLSRWSLA